MKFEDKKNISSHFNEYDFKKLKIKFLHKDEIKIFSTLCQDGIFSIDEIIYNKKLHNKENLKYFRNTIKIGKDILDLISKFDIGQSIVARKNHILGIEGIEGTNELIKRCGKHYKKQLKEDNVFGPVLIKLPKLHQTLDLDIPVIGIDTVKLAYNYNFFGIGFLQKGVLVVNETEIRSFCENKNFYLFCIGE